MKEYEQIAVQQKESLLKESKLMKVKYSSETQQTINMERTVNNISSMINEFTNLIDSQSEVVGSVEQV